MDDLLVRSPCQLAKHFFDEPIIVYVHRWRLCPDMLRSLITVNPNVAPMRIPPSLPVLERRVLQGPPSGHSEQVLSSHARPRRVLGPSKF